MLRFLFVCVSDDYVFYLDPHLVRPCVKPEQKNFNPRNFHCAFPKKMPLEDIDPSLAVGFYCKDRAAVDEFCDRAAEISQRVQCSVFHVEREAPHYSDAEESDDEFVVL